MANPRTDLRAQLDLVGRRLLSECDRDAVSPTRGCCDRRYWGWKLVDFPEATFQRNAMLLAWLAEQEPEGALRTTLQAAARDAVLFAARCQHRDGSFDQAYPYERSYAATAFLLLPLLRVQPRVAPLMTGDEEKSFRDCLRRAADYLARHDEYHAPITNHLAGAAAALTAAAAFFADDRHARAATALTDRIIASQSAEGWYPEYTGADPGYQTLCLYYLARVQRQQPTEKMRHSLAAAVEFVAWSVHPDGTFAGEYGSRRTAVFYPGGLALLAAELPTAAALLRVMLPAIAARRTVTLADIDLGNLAPLAENYIATLEAPPPPPGESPLPMEKERADGEFPAAGLVYRSRPRYYAVLGAGHGALLKVFDKEKRRLAWNDGGYWGRLRDGRMIATQATGCEARVERSTNRTTVIAPFVRLALPTPTPARFLLLRLANLTLMRVPKFNELLKKLLVRFLITGQQPVPITLQRTVGWDENEVTVHDEVIADGPLPLVELRAGVPFVALHMASARYFEQARECDHAPPISIPAEEFRGTNKAVREYRVFPAPDK